MASLTALLGFANEHMDFAIAQNQGIAEYLYNGLGLTVLPDQVVVVTPPDFLGPRLDRLLMIRNEIGREAF